MRIAVFASHNGSDLQAIIDACKSGILNAIIDVEISNNSDSKALERANSEDIANYHISSKVYGSDEQVEKKILDVLSAHSIDLVFLAGYLKKIGASVLRKYHNRIFNIHPALLPKYGGKGMYGINVHRAVIDAKEIKSGITIHRVNEKYDDGEIVAQKIVELSKDETPETLATKILKHEHIFLVEFLLDVISGKIPLGC